jgi:hypothetical protein
VYHDLSSTVDVGLVTDSQQAPMGSVTECGCAAGRDEECQIGTFQWKFGKPTTVCGSSVQVGGITALSTLVSVRR